MKIYLTFVMIFFCGSLFAQSNHSTELFDKFVRICTEYRQAPLQLQLNFLKKTNMPSDETDTASAEAKFYLSGKNAYIKFGKLEQISTDSMVLTILSDINQMILTPHGLGEEQMNLALQMPGTISERVKAEYEIESPTENGPTKSIIISSRRSVTRGGKPSEEFVLVYNDAIKVPITITTVQRKPVKKTEQNKSVDAKTISIGDKGEFLVKESSTVYQFLSVKHDANVPLPVLPSQRIIKGEDNNYIPVKAFENYTLTLN